MSKDEEKRVHAVEQDKAEIMFVLFAWIIVVTIAIFVQLLRDKTESSSSYANIVRRIHSDDWGRHLLMAKINDQRIMYPMRLRPPPIPRTLGLLEPSFVVPAYNCQFPCRK